MILQKKCRLTSESGFSLVEQIVVFAILGILVSISAGLLPNLLNSLKRENSISTLNLLRSRFITTIRDGRAWETTVVDDPSGTNGTVFECWENGTDCSALVGSPAAFTPLQANGNALEGYDPLNNPTHGFTLEGNLCNTYNAATPDPNCPVRIDFTWEPVCATTPPPPCIKPEFRVVMDFTISTTFNKNTPSINFNQLDTTITLVGESQVVSGYVCNTHQVVSGFSSEGNLNCVDGEVIFGGQQPPP